MTGTELKIVTPAETEVLGPEVDRLATLHTNARTTKGGQCGAPVPRRRRSARTPMSSSVLILTCASGVSRGHRARPATFC